MIFCCSRVCVKPGRTQVRLRVPVSVRIRTGLSRRRANSEDQFFMVDAVLLGPQFWLFGLQSFFFHVFPQGSVLVFFSAPLSVCSRTLLDLASWLTEELTSQIFWDLASETAFCTLLDRPIPSEFTLSGRYSLDGKCTWRVWLFAEFVCFPACILVCGVPSSCRGAVVFSSLCWCCFSVDGRACCRIDSCQPACSFFACCQQLTVGWVLRTMLLALNPLVFDNSRVLDS